MTPLHPYDTTTLVQQVTYVNYDSAEQCQEAAYLLQEGNFMMGVRVGVL